MLLMFNKYTTIENNTHVIPVVDTKVMGQYQE